MAVIVLKDEGMGPAMGSCMVNVAVAHRPRHGGPALRQPAFNWMAPDMYTELLNFEMLVMNIL